VVEEELVDVVACPRGAVTVGLLVLPLQQQVNILGRWKGRLR